jgi:hypothetical protein
MGEPLTVMRATKNRSAKKERPLPKDGRRLCSAAAVTKRMLLESLRHRPALNMLLVGGAALR